jgi:hypothetical protein
MPSHAWPFAAEDNYPQPGRHEDHRGSYKASPRDLFDATACLSPRASDEGRELSLFVSLFELPPTSRLGSRIA